jgi:LemA protein
VSVIATAAVVLLVLFLAGALVDRVGRLHRNVKKNWRQLEQQRHARHEIIGRIAAACANAAADAGSVDGVIAARKMAAAPAGPAEAARKERLLGDAVGRLLTASAISMDAKVSALAQELADADRAYRAARQIYNDTATRYNRAISMTPGNVIAGVLGFRRAELFEPKDEHPNPSPPTP